VAVKLIVDWAQTVTGFAGVAVFDGCMELYNETVERWQADILLYLLNSSPGARRASASAGGSTLVAFRAGDYAVVVKVAGRFPVLPEIRIEEPAFVDPSCSPALPSQAEARREAEAVLRQLGLI
jgi:hypothetical protein